MTEYSALLINWFQIHNIRADPSECPQGAKESDYGFLYFKK
jgi:hypothetical protein